MLGFPVAYHFFWYNEVKNLVECFSYTISGCQVFVWDCHSYKDGCLKIYTNLLHTLILLHMIIHYAIICWTATFKIWIYILLTKWNVEAVHTNGPGSPDITQLYTYCHMHIVSNIFIDWKLLCKYSMYEIHMGSWFYTWIFNPYWMTRIFQRVEDFKLIPNFAQRGLQSQKG